MMESQIQRDILLKLSKMGLRLFRNNVGKAYVGRTTRVRHANQFVPLEPGDVVVHKARIFHAGLCEGSADLIGWTPLKITEDMVGQEVAVFTAVECKSRRGVLRPKQKQFVSNVAAAGGISMVPRSADEAVSVIESIKGTL